MKKLYKIVVAVVIIATAGMTAYNTQDKKNTLIQHSIGKCGSIGK